MHALAELMDNATKFSKPSEDVHVHVEQLSSGVIIVEDAGIGMSCRCSNVPNAPCRPPSCSTSSPCPVPASAWLSGCLARNTSYGCGLRRSPRGGVSAVLRIPAVLVTQPRAEDEPTVRNRRPVETDSPRSTQPASQSSAARLPKRRRGQTLVSSPPPRTRHRVETKPRADAGARFNAFRAAVRPDTPPTTAD